MATREPHNWGPFVRRAPLPPQLAYSAVVKNQYSGDAGDYFRFET
jgi:hypothetical protein